MGFFDKLRQGLNKTKESINEKINDVFSNFRKVDEGFLNELEEALIMSDIGIETSCNAFYEIPLKECKQDQYRNQGNCCSCHDLCIV